MPGPHVASPRCVCNPVLLSHPALINNGCLWTLPVGPEEPTPHERACYNKLRLQRFFNTFIGYHKVCFQPTSLHHDPMADFFSRVTSIRAVAGRRATPHCIPACFDSSRTLTSTVRISRRWRREANTLMTRGAKTS